MLPECLNIFNKPNKPNKLLKYGSFLAISPKFPEFSPMQSRTLEVGDTRKYSPKSSCLTFEALIYDEGTVSVLH